MKDVQTKIENIERVAKDIWRLSFCAELAGFTPGQFVMVKVPGKDVFLRRPFSVACLENGVAEIYFKVAGAGTEALAKAKAGDVLDVLGPCGRGFSIPDGVETAVLVAGGYGVAPLFGLAKLTRAKGLRTVFYLGGKTKDDIFLTERFADLGVETHIATEDGGLGTKGLVTELLSELFRGFGRPALFSCGPEGLLDEVAKFGIAQRAPVQVSREAHMACGIGACMGCVRKDAFGKYVRVCKEGPVFTVSSEQ